MAPKGKRKKGKESSGDHNSFFPIPYKSNGEKGRMDFLYSLAIHRTQKEKKKKKKKGNCFCRFLIASFAKQ